LKTLKLHITRLEGEDFVREKQVRFSNALILVYNRLDESEDKNFTRCVMERFQLNDIEYRSVKSDATAARNQDATRDKQFAERIQSISEDLFNNEVPYHKRFKLFNRIQQMQRRIGKPQVFGSVQTLRELTRECNKDGRDEAKVEQLRKQYHEKRVQPLFVIGEGNYKGNRFFDFLHLADGVCVYKPCKKQHYEIRFKVPKHQRNELERVAEYAVSHKQPVSVRLSTEFLYLTYDEQALHGYALDKKSRSSDVKKVKEKGLPKDAEKEEIKAVYRECGEEQRNRMWKDKIPNRCMAVDLNPTNIGWSVTDKVGNGVTVVAAGQFDLSQLCTKLGLPSANPKSKRQANKRKYELTIALKKLFDIACHYKCSVFGMEDLSFKTDNTAASREANRKVRNLWCRTLCEQIIEKRCNECGIELRKVNACYSSFIGNIQHNYVDATNASVETGRRALLKFDKGTGLFPELRQEDMRTVEARFGPDAACGNAVGWVGLYKSLMGIHGVVELNHRARVALKEASPHRTHRMNSYKSLVFLIHFT
jgi:hypothetical protein